MNTGSSLGRYRIAGKIGEGGMGQVFLAEDDRLHRQVAIKILPPQLRNDRDRLTRMEREAHALAQLEHPNIAGIYGLEEATPEGEQTPIPFLVMQYAEGKTLSSRIDLGPMRVDEAVPIALQIARALEAAHDKGIVHRDLKPANIVLSDEGNVKLLDFGLAKAFSSNASGSIHPDISASPTVVGTHAGTILGTAGYMSPEQARGKAVDRRTDIWAFGCVLFEMLTGRTMFPGETVTDVLGAILHRDPDWKALPADTPKAIRAVLERCLRKDIHRRAQSIGDVRIALEEYKEQPAVDEPIPVAATPARPLRLQLVPWALLGVVTVVAGALAFMRPSGPATAAQVGRFSVEIGDAPLYDAMSALAVSHDGSRVAIVQNLPRGRRLTVRPLDQLSGTEVTGIDPPYNPFFSPDGQWIGFVTQTALQKAPTTGGTALTLAQVNRSRGATWTDDDAIILAPSPNEGLSRMPASGGQLTPLTTLSKEKNEATHRWPQYVSGRDVVIFTAHTQTTGFDGATIEALNLKTNERKTVYRGGSFGRYIPSGHLLFVNKDVIYAAPFDIQRMEVVGSPSPVSQAITYSSGEGSAQLAVGNSGLAVYRSGRGGAQVYEALWVDQRGDATQIWDGSRTYGEPRISPDGTKVAFMVFADNDWDLWVYDRERKVSTRLTFTPGVDGPGVWSPDSRYVAYSSAASGTTNVYRKRADGSGEAERLTEGKIQQYVSSWSPDGKFVIYNEQVNATDLWIAPVEGDRKPRAFLATNFNESEGAFAPDGRWVAYQSNESGRIEVYVRPLSGAGKWQISEGGGGYPRWSGDGRQLFFRDNEGVMSVSIKVAGDTIEVGRAQRALKGAYRGGADGFNVGNLRVADYDVARDGAHFVVFPLDAGAAGRTEHLTFVLNWFTELERLLPSRK